MAENITPLMFSVSIDQLDKKLQTWTEKINAFVNNGGKGYKLKIDFGDVEDTIKLLKNLKFGDSQEIQRLQRELDGLKKRLDEINKSASSRSTDNMRKAGIAVSDLALKFNRLELAELRANAIKANVDTSAYDKAIERIQRYQRVLEYIQQRGGHDVSRILGSVGYRTSLNDLNVQSAALTKNIAEKERAANATRQLTADEQRLAQALGQSTDHMNRQSTLLSDLKSLATQYLGVWGGQQFLNNIIEIGGQLEMQRLSIGAILQDTAHANDLFDRIKGLALQSPFGVVELDQFTKQLSAYGFKYNELFDMTKRLADISAGAGTDVSRLALALGHVRSEGALTGYTLRQFAMNNIPMLGKLSEKLSELEGRIVTAAEVRKRVRNKEIDYGMVESVIKDLTNEGGMFYNMQEVISGSVKAKWKNLHDAFDIMFGEMAESAVGGALKGMATLLTSVAKEWKTLGAVGMSTVGVFAIAKAAMMAHNMLLGQQSAAVLRTIAAERQAEISKLRLAQSYRYLTAAEKATLMSTNRLRASEIATAISSKALTAEQLSKAVAMGKVSKATALVAIRNSTLDEIQKQQMRTTILNTAVLGTWGKAMYGVRAAVLATGAALKTLFANPMTWILALVSGITYLWQKNSEEMKRAAELSKSLAERASEGVKNVQTMMTETGITYKKDGKEVEFGKVSGGEIGFTPAASLDSDAMIQVMERWEEFIKNYSSTPNTLIQNALFDGDKMRDLADQYENLAHATESVMKAQLALAQIADSSEFIINSTQTTKMWGVFDDDIITNMNDYAKSVRKTDAAVSKFSMSHRGAMMAALNAAKSNQYFAQGLAAANAEMQKKEGRNLTEEEQLRHLAYYSDAYAVAVRNAEQAIADLGDNEAMRKAQKAFTSLMSTGNNENVKEVDLTEDMNAAADAIRQTVREKWHKDISELEEYEKQALLQMVSDIAAKSGESTDVIRKHIIELFSNVLHIPIDIDDVDAHTRISQIQQELDKLMAGPNGDGVYPLDIRGVVDADDLVQKVRQAYKKAKDAITNLGPIAIHMGISLDRVKNMTDEEINKAAGGSFIRKMALQAIQKAYKEIDAAETTAKEYGISLIDETKGGKVFKAGKGNTGKKTGAGHKEDTQAKAWRERIRQLKDARQWYDKWEKEIGETSALEKVQEIFHGLIRKEDIKTLEAYEKALKAVKSEAESRKAKNKGKDERAEEIIRQTDDELAQIDMLKFQRDSETALGKMDKYLDRVARHWETFKSVLEATGDRMLAMKLAGFDEYDSNFAVSSADALLNRLEMEMMLPDLQQQLIDAGIMEMSDTEIEKYIKNWLGGTEYKKYIDAITKGVKEWKRMEQSYINESVQDYARLIGSAVDYQTQVDKINAEYAKTREHLTKLLELGQEGKEGGITKEQYDEALELARVMRDDKTLKLSSTYLNLLNRANALSRDEMLSAFEIAVSNLDQKLSHGLITLEDYTQELAKLKKITEEWEENAFFGKNNMLTNFLQGGAPGLKNWLEVRRDRYEASGEQDEADTYQGYINKLDDVTNLLGDLGVVVELATGALDGMQKATTALSNMFEALGLHGKANRWSDISSGIGAVSSAFNPVSNVIQNAQSGNVGGLLSSVISAPFEMITSPIKGFAELHDRKRERAIEEIRKEVQQIGNTLNLIRMSRERTLGFDKGEYRRMMAALYAGSNTASGKGMYEYYTRGGTDSNGYMQELQMLKQQREDYLKMYDKEHSKKNESKEALEEYKTKIAELDDQIRNFSEDMAKELWDIDIKGWADQLSDALASAFENGESMAKAYKDTVKSILQTVLNDMLRMKIIEPMLKSLEDKLFGDKGAFDPNDIEGSMSKVMATFGEFFGEGGEGQKMITAANEMMTASQRALEPYGLSVYNDSGKTLSASVQGVTEDTAGLLAGYVNALRQDVSAMRLLNDAHYIEFIDNYWSGYMVQVTGINGHVAGIHDNTTALVRMIEQGDGALYNAISRMSDHFDRVTMGIEKVYMA